MLVTRFASLLALFSALALGCGESEVLDYTSGNDGPNPFLDDQQGGAKMDSHYTNPGGVEVEVDIEADIEAPSSRLDTGPATLAQYAMTYLRNSGELYLESLAEDASSPERIEWQIDGEWVKHADVGTLPEGALPEGALPEGKLHFRIRAMNAVLLLEHATRAREGEVFTAPVPVRPYAVMTEGGKSCVKEDGHISLSLSVYWYIWAPEKAGCTLETQTMTLTVSQVLPQSDSYPEYDRLIADGKITGVVLFGQIGDDMSENDPGFRNLKRMARNLEWADYVEVEAPLGRRFQKNVNGVVLEIDLYSPNEFSGLSDHANFNNFEHAVQDYEIVAYDGHSMLGASDFWARPEYKDNYQIYLYGGCLGYEYYVRPIVDGKGGWDNVDIVSSVIEVSADANYYAGPVFAKLEKAIENNYEVTWDEILGAIRTKVGDSTFGASGVRENCFDPAGNRCE